ncbi:MAG: hypothetical protein AMQ22_00010 [Candidatus Methanofastidiosum methylothiophilum]|uniref:Uncharacterized protein n=1 Tax=Candidatus Methanofastidiosum methylothiophilum TaxID=1705564 RepID=A0A150J9D0_9EURY|nr:MAG: hypothetical protein AMQ22_00010 [Candidatus Methanofastidiosum methylthiophilus]
MYELTQKQKDVLNYYFENHWWGDKYSDKQYKNFMKYHTQWIVNDSYKQKVKSEEIELEIYNGEKNWVGLRHLTSLNLGLRK